MSRTDSTRPYWVQLRDPDFPWPIRAHHRCFGNSYRQARKCDLDFPLPVTRRGYERFTRYVGDYPCCEYWLRWRDNDKIYGRPGFRRSFRFFQNGRARADLRRLRAGWLKENDREEIDSTENLPTSRWRWRRWYWD